QDEGLRQRPGLDRGRLAGTLADGEGTHRRLGRHLSPLSHDPPKSRLMLSRLPITLAWKNLTESKKRLATSVAGTAFAVVLMFMENGFRNGLLDGTGAGIRRTESQPVLINPQGYVLREPVQVPRTRLEPARSSCCVTHAG